MVSVKCPYGDLGDHLAGTANCEDENCAFKKRYKPFAQQAGPRSFRKKRVRTDIVEGANAVIDALNNTKEKP